MQKNVVFLRGPSFVSAEVNVKFPFLGSCSASPRHYV